MAGLLDIFGTGGGEALGLLGGDVSQSRNDAQAQALYALAGSLLSGGPTGQSIVRGLQQGGNAYRDTMKGATSDQMDLYKLQEFKRKQAEEQAAKARQNTIDRAVAGAYQPGVSATPTQFYGQETSMPLMDDEGNMMPGAAAPTEGRAAGFDLQRLAPALMGSPEGRKTLSELMAAQKAMGGETFKLGEGEKQYSRDPITGQIKEVAVGAPKKEKVASDIEKYQYAVQNDGYKGTFTQFLYNERRAGAPNVSVNTGQKGLENTLKLRGDFRSEPIYKAHQEVQSAYGQIGAGLNAGTPVGDLAAATKMMKLLDPGSVVRESELGMAMAATGLQDRLTNYAQNVISGNKLTPKQRVEFQSLANQFLNESTNQYNAKRTEYQGIAERNQLNIPDVVGNPAKTAKPTPISLESRLEKYK